MTIKPSFRHHLRINMFAMKNCVLLFLMCWSTFHLQGQDDEDATKNYDFWLGKWEATWDEGNGKVGKGTNYVHTTLDGKVIQENFEILEGQNKGFKGKSFSVYNPRKKEWRQAWADNQGGYYDFTGEKIGDKRYFKTAVFKQGDKEIIQRMVFYNIQQDSMTWDWELSVDGGKTWQLSWRINYKKNK